jgi:hypothetical protein
MIAVDFGYALFSETNGGTWLSREMWPSDYFDWLSQLDGEAEGAD